MSYGYATCPVTSGSRFGIIVPRQGIEIRHALLLRRLRSRRHAGVARRSPFDRLRFTGPVFIGDTVRVTKRVIDLREKDAERGVVTFETRKP